MDKYEELFQLAKYVVDEDIQRFIRIDEKASKYLSSFTLLFGIVTYASKWSLDRFIPIRNILDFFGIISLIVLIILIILAWYFAFKCLKTHDLRRIPLNNDIINFFESNNLVTIYFALSKKFKDAYQENKEKTNKKAGYLAWSYNFIMAALVFIIIFLF